MRGKQLFALLITWAIVGGVVVYVLPWGDNLLGKIANPTVQNALSKKWVQVLVVGGIVTLAGGIFVAVARNLKIPTE